MNRLYQNEFLLQLMVYSLHGVDGRIVQLHVGVLILLGRGSVLDHSTVDYHVTILYIRLRSATQTHVLVSEHFGTNVNQAQQRCGICPYFLIIVKIKEQASM